MALEGLERDAGGEPRAGGGRVGRVDGRQVLRAQDAREVPAQRAVGARVVLHRVEGVGLVQEDAELELDAVEAGGEHVHRLARRAGLLRVEEEEHEVGELGEGADGGGEVVGAGGGALRRVDHAGGVDEVDALEEFAVADLDGEVLEEVGPEGAERLELGGELAEGGGAVELVLVLAVDEDRERVVGRRDAGVLHGRVAEQVVHDGGLAGGVVAEEDDGRLAAGRDLGAAERVAVAPRGRREGPVEAVHARLDVGGGLSESEHVVFLSARGQETAFSTRAATSSAVPEASTRRSLPAFS